MRDRRREDRAMQEATQNPDSGFCTSINDSESEAESLSQANLLNQNINEGFTLLLVIFLVYSFKECFSQ